MMGRFSVSRRHRALIVTGAIGVAVISVIVSATPALSVRTVTVDGGNEALNRSTQSALQSVVGTPLMRVNTAALKETALAVSPSVRDVDVRRVLPGTIEVTVTRRSPVLRWTDTKTSTTSLVDESGVVFGRGARAPKGTPTLVVAPELTASERERAVMDAATVLAAVPEPLRPKVKSMEVKTRDDIRFALLGDRDVRWGSTSDADVKAAVLLRLAKAVPADVYDVSAPELPTTRNRS